MEDSKLTPMQQQYFEIKKKYSDFILFFRLGDFYEMFEEDAENASRILDIALTQRNGQKMCGFPYHALDNYLHKIIKAGRKAAICEQVEEPGKGKIVRRQVVEVMTPGTFTSEKYLSSEEDSFLTALHFSEDKIIAVCADASTGKFWLIEEKRSPERLSSLLKLVNPSEIILSEYPKNFESIIKNYYSTLVPEYYFSPAVNEIMLLEHFKVGTLKGLGIENPFFAGASAAVLRYLKDNLLKEIKHLDHIRFIRPEEFVYLPEATVRNLEILEPLFTSQKNTSLFQNLNQTLTSMGARELRNWLIYPLMDIEKINERLSQTEFLKDRSDISNKIRTILKNIPDLERMLSRIGLFKTNPKEVIAFKEGLKNLELLKTFQELPFDEMKTLNPLLSVISQIEKTVYENPPIDFSEGGVIQEGIDPELDSLKNITQKGKEYLLEIEKREKEKTGINTLKLRYNKVIGYYIEITKANQNSVPKEYIRKQSMVNAERYTIEELIEYESKILDAKSSLIELEKKIFNQLLMNIIEQVKEIRANIIFVKKLDIIASFAKTAKERKYTRPLVNDELKITIEEGRHPVVELFTDQFIPNSIKLDEKENRLLLITGPNMAGKSTYLRQAALIVLMAHIGCFVPAKKAVIGLTDQIFTRIGASDNLAGGESTFLVEMTETSQILRNSTQRSLIVMDEVGRGTSTHDGLSLAWAIVEYLNNPSKNRGKTLFATHYHEMTVLGEERGIKNHRVAVKEWNNEIVFLHKVEEGASDKSYGIHVAEIAGIPLPVIERAKEILASMEISLIQNENKFLKKRDDSENMLFSVAEDPFEKIKTKILSVDILQTTPIQAILILENLQKEIRKNKG